MLNVCTQTIHPVMRNSYTIVRVVWLALFTVTVGIQVSHQLQCPSINSTIVPRIPTHNFTCNSNTTGTLRYNNKSLEICDGVDYVSVCQKASSFGLSKEKPAKSCLEILSKNSKAQSGMYYLHFGVAVVKAYCYMDEMCGSKGWTMIMKIDGTKTTFHYASPYWTNKATYNIAGASGGLDYQETKLETYSTFPFTLLCLGMKTANVTNWMPLEYPASSLHSLTADNKYRQTNLGRAAWKSLILGASLQSKCNLEGFNVRAGYGTMARIGILGNNENNCWSADSRLGFGTGGNRCGQDDSNSVGNEGHCSSDNGERSIKSHGYIFAQTHLGIDTLGNFVNPAGSCQEIRTARSEAVSGPYYLNLNGTINKVYCHMESICNSRGWTMVMKIDGLKQTFAYDSKYWTTDEVYNVEAVQQGMETRQEMKLKTYSLFPIKKLCLGMKANDVIRWMTIENPSDPTTLYSVISSNNYVRSEFGRDVWMSLVPGSSLQKHCNREGLNVQVESQRARIGIISSEYENCKESGSRIGYGTYGTRCNQGHSTAGYERGCDAINGDKSIPVLGFILAK